MDSTILVPQFRQEIQKCRTIFEIELRFRDPEMTFHWVNDSLSHNIIPFNKPYLVGNELELISKQVMMDS